VDKTQQGAPTRTIAGLAFRDQGTAFEEAKLGIFAASIVAVIMGTLILKRE
jgi:Na+/H+ antiporter NhaA